MSSAGEWAKAQDDGQTTNAAWDGRDGDENEAGEADGDSRNDKVKMYIRITRLNKT